MEVDCFRLLHSPLMLSNHFPWIDILLLLEVDLENMGAAEGKVSPLAGQSGQMLDRGAPSSPWPAAPPSMITL
jgi:hypothetical protein